MVELVHSSLNSTRLLFDLQQANKIAEGISGCLDADAIARHVTDSLVSQFECVFARIWLTEPDQATLRLVASSGLYTHTNGSFARVAMGAYKVGKIAQNRVPFLSNQLPEEPWVKDRAWAKAHRIQGFAGYPLAVGDRVLGVLATFSHSPLAPEFLEVLQVLCMTTTVALDAALQAQQALQDHSRTYKGISPVSLSDQMASLLTTTRLMLMGTEKPLAPATAHLLLRLAEVLNQLGCNYCRLTYEDQIVALEALIPLASGSSSTALESLQAHFREIQWLADCLKGSFDLEWSQQRALQCLLKLPITSQLTHKDLPWDRAEVGFAENPAAPVEDEGQRFSEREQEIITLLAQGLRDRDIAHQLHISESTVKFHINNSATKLNAKNRYQTVYQAAIRGWI